MRRSRVVPVALLLSVACADTPRAAGGLQLGMDEAPLRPPARLETGVTFEYPPEAWSDGAGGTTVLRLLISRQGTVDSAMIVQSSGHPALDSAALANARSLRYQPAAQGGTPVEVWGRLPVIFPVPGEGGGEPYAGP